VRDWLEKLEIACNCNGLDGVGHPELIYSEYMLNIALIMRAACRVVMELFMFCSISQSLFASAKSLYPRLWGIPIFDTIQKRAIAMLARRRG
jgi:hypothetical protein